MSSVITLSLYGKSYKNIYNEYVLSRSKFENSIGKYSFNEFVNGYNFEKKSFVIHGKNFISIKTIRGKDTILYERTDGKSFIITNGKRIPIETKIKHWTNIQIPPKGRIVGETMIYNTMCYHIQSDSMELWMDEKNNIPLMILYKGTNNVQVIISKYIKIGKGLLFPAQCTIFINKNFYSNNVIYNFKYTGG